MGVKEILDFVKIEHTLFSLPFVFIGAWVAGNPTALQLTWILIAAVGARGLAMSLNRIIDRDVDAENPRTSERHLVEGTMSLNTAWGLCAIFLTMLIFGAWKLNEVALAMSWLPVLVFIVYPYTKRITTFLIKISSHFSHRGGPPKKTKTDYPKSNIGMKFDKKIDNIDHR